MRSLRAKPDVTDRVVAALSVTSGGLTLSDLATAVGQPVGTVSTTLILLERPGIVRFSCGRWHLLETWRAAPPADGPRDAA